MNAMDLKILDMFFLEHKDAAQIAKELKLSEAMVRAVLLALNEEDDTPPNVVPRNEMH